MAYSVINSKGQSYYLHGRLVTLKGGLKRKIYFFAKTQKDGVLNELPEGFEVIENKKTGLPFLKRA